ncbi:MAG: hypothetical protein H7249_04480 [Chitinophagaceae bacterium]|nr:hypothetical protein [Oligoflexus sp.]
MPINRHISLLENRTGQLQSLLRTKGCSELGYGCLLNVIAEGDGWSDWQDFMDHGRFAAIERNWFDRTLKALDRLGIEGLKLDDLKKLEQFTPREDTRSREVTM